jgi:hypothetical protein
MRMEYNLNLELVGGINSSTDIATGVRLKAYVLLIKEQHIFFIIKNGVYYKYLQ